MNYLQKNKGFMSVRILVPLVVSAVIAVLVCVIIAPPVTTRFEMRELANQVSQKTWRQLQLIDQGLRNTKMSVSDYSTKILGPVLSKSIFAVGTSAPITETDASACTTSNAGRNGIVINLAVGGEQQPNEEEPLCSAQLSDLQELLIGAIKKAVDQSDTEYKALFAGATVDIGDLDHSKAATMHTGHLTARSSHKIYLCIDDGA